MTLEGAGDVAKTTVDALKGSPALLMIVVLNVVMVLAVGYVAQQQRTERQEMRAKDDAIIKVLTDLCAQHPPNPGG